LKLKIKKLSMNLKLNNFDLIRLLAASQVALTHIAAHLGYTNFFFQVIAIFPGVPIFFLLVVS
jgi:peptidoglycan/LPS O-acetylase OafA/YrhL